MELKCKAAPEYILLRAADMAVGSCLVKVKFNASKQMCFSYLVLSESLFTFCCCEMCLYFSPLKHLQQASSHLISPYLTSPHEQCFCIRHFWFWFDLSHCFFSCRCLPFNKPIFMSVPTSALCPVNRLPIWDVALTLFPNHNVCKNVSSWLPGPRKMKANMTTCPQYAVRGPESEMHYGSLWFSLSIKQTKNLTCFP